MSTRDELTSFSFVLILTHLIGKGCSIHPKPEIDISIPSTHTTLSGDLHIKIQSTSLPPLLIQLSRLEGDTVQLLTNFSISPDAQSLIKNQTVLSIPCGYFARGGKYYVLVRQRTIDEFFDGGYDDTPIITQAIDVRWPVPQLKIVPNHIQTYPKVPVVATLEFPEVVCPPKADYLAAAIPEFWLELHYCGHSPSSCDIFSKHNQSFQILHAEQVRGFPGSRNITLQCEYFGLAGHYALFLRPTSMNSWLSYQPASIKADWSEEFVFNVHAQSIFPCDRHDGGITVLFQYPACILFTGDRVRVFAKHRTEVAALVPPTKLEYVAEQKVLRGSNKLKFDCDLFSERYIEYCFVYVSQAITGAVADVRMNCVPTLPVREHRSGGWGPWTSWTPCSSTCIGGTKTRYRLCDSPLTRFGGKYCEGPAVETEKCGTEIGNIWDCFDGNFDKLDHKVADTPRVKEEVGIYCRCGCVVHLGRANPRRILATSSQSCPGRIFWQIQGDENCIIQFRIEWFHSSCGIQWLKIRDGMSLSSNLLADLSDSFEIKPSVINSTGATMLLEFFSDELINNGQLCGGGFLAYARQVENINISPLTHRVVGASPLLILKLNAVHSTTIFFLSGLLIAMALLGAQYTFRYRKYHIAFMDDQDSVADPSVSCTTLMSRRSSTSTLFSDVLSLHQFEQKTISDSYRRHHVNLEDDYSKGAYQSSKPQISEKDSTSEFVSNENFATNPSTANIETDQEIAGCSSTITECTEKESQEIHKPMESSASKELEDKNTPIPAKGLYSSRRRKINTATIRNTIPKETKDKKNREKLLAGPCGSDFSISGAEVDLEIDYYDYNVRNAGAAPGSYLGMDPAFLVYIPPLYGSGEISADNEDDQDEMESSPEKDYVRSEEEGTVLMRKSFHFENGTGNQNSKGNECADDSLKERVKEREKEKPSREEDLSSPVLQKQPVIYESKYARQQLQHLSDENNIKKLKGKIEEFSMIDSNILDEIRYVDEDEDEKH